MALHPPSIEAIDRWYSTPGNATPAQRAAYLELRQQYLDSVARQALEHGGYFEMLGRVPSGVIARLGETCE